MKPSELMLEGFAMAGERQCIRLLCEGDFKNPSAVCALGAINLAETGAAHDGYLGLSKPAFKARNFWFERFGCSLATENDQGMSIPDIAGILAAEGL